MLVTNHVLSGAVIGALARSPLLAFPLGFASHLVLDAAPHWGQLESRKKFLQVAVADGLTGLAVMAAATAAAEPRRRAAVVAGMVGAALPDLNKPALLFFGRSPFPEPFEDLHRRIQHEAPDRFLSHEVAGGAAFAAVLAALAVGARWRAAREAAAGGQPS
ncbi:MAG TPA: hypothetical protein VGX23_35820 [Actinocrinis sp.]|nr:hypothetical protein [Actinocrinis sp.]